MSRRRRDDRSRSRNGLRRLCGYRGDHWLLHLGGFGLMSDVQGPLLLLGIVFLLLANIVQAKQHHCHPFRTDSRFGIACDNERDHETSNPGRDGGFVGFGGQ
jgi:hypothetical protein